MCRWFCERAVVAEDRRRSHVIDVGRRFAGIDALKMYDRNDRSPIASRRERQPRIEEGSHTHRRENGRGDAGGSLEPDGSGGSRLRLRRLVHPLAGVTSTCEATRHRLPQRSRCRTTGSSWFHPSFTSSTNLTYRVRWTRLRRRSFTSFTRSARPHIRRPSTRAGRTASAPLRTIAFAQTRAPGPRPAACLRRTRNRRQIRPATLFPNERKPVLTP